MGRRAKADGRRPAGSAPPAAAAGSTRESGVRGVGRDPRDDPHGAERAAESDAFTNEPVAVPITDELDLHAFPARDVPELVAEYLREAQQAGLTEVRIVHGKGIGVQREVVARVLATHPAVASYGPAPAHRGHWGATIVILRRA